MDHGLGVDGFCWSEAGGGRRLVVPVVRGGLFRRWWRSRVFVHPCSFLIGMGVGGYMVGVTVWVVALWL